MKGTDSSSDRNPVEELAEEFVGRHRRGERPSIDEYTENHPDLADEIRELFPALVTMEQLKPGTMDATGGFTTADGQPPSKLGDYRILREVGRGGMGVVYEAEQESLGRHVALKLLRAHFLTSSKQFSRFQREARAAARLHHTNIVPVFGVGREGNAHYYVMQLIQGQPLDDVVDELKWLHERRDLPAAESADRSGPLGARPGGSSASGEVARRMFSGQYPQGQTVTGLDATADTERNGSGESEPPSAIPGAEFRDGSSGSSSTAVLLGETEISSATHSARGYWKSVARVGVQLADALDYAHRQGVLHRDIKPSNVLLDAGGTAWVTDFGLAKAVEPDDRSALTEPGDIVGTLRYMAPESLKGKADGRTDVCGLGLTLYELVALRPAFDDASRGQLIQRISKGEITPLRQLNRQVPRDLETIVMKSVAPDPAHRYSTAHDLGADLQRFLNDQPILARRISPPERFARWCRRNPVVAGLTITVALLLMVTIVASLITAVQFKGLAAEARDAEKREAAARRLAEQREQAVTLNLNVAWKAIDESLTRVADDPRMKASRLEKVRLGVLETARKFYLDLVEQGPNDPSFHVMYAKAHFRLADISVDTGELSNAETMYRKGLEIIDRLSPEQREAREYRDLIPQIHSVLGSLYRKESRWKEARESCEKALEILNGLVAEGQETEQTQFQLAVALTALGTVDVMTGHMDQAEGRLLAALEIRKDLGPEAGDDLIVQSGLGTNYTRLGHLYGVQPGRLDEAEKKFVAARDVFARLNGSYEDVPEVQEGLAAAYQNLGIVYEATARPRQAEEAYNKAIEIFTGLVTGHPDQPEFKHLRGGAYTRLGYLHEVAVQLDKAEAAYKAAMEDFKDLSPVSKKNIEFAVSLGGAYCNLANTRRAGGDPRASLPYYDNAIRLLEPIADQPEPLIARTFLQNSFAGQATAYDMLKQYAEAAVAWRRALELDTGAKRNTLRRALVLALTFAGDHAQAVDEGRVLVKGAGDDVSSLVAAAQAYGMAAAAAIADGSIAESNRGEMAQLAAIKIWARLVDKHPEVPEYQMGLAGYHNRLADLYVRTRRFKEALEAYDRAIDVLERLLKKRPKHEMAKSFLRDWQRHRPKLVNALKQSGQTRAIEPPSTGPADGVSGDPLRASAGASRPTRCGPILALTFPARHDSHNGPSVWARRRQVAARVVVAASADGSDGSPSGRMERLSALPVYDPTCLADITIADLVCEPQRKEVSRATQEPERRTCVFQSTLVCFP